MRAVEAPPYQLALKHCAAKLVPAELEFARDRADHCLLMERGEFTMRGLGCDMDKDGVCEALAA